MKLLIKEDESQLADAVAEMAKRAGYLTDVAYDGATGLDHALTGIYDAIVLDIMLPELNGFDVLRKLREAKISTPVLLLTAKSEVRDKIAGLDHGADDYLTKPFHTGELLARLRALTRRQGEIVDDEMRCGDVTLSPRTYELTCAGNSVRLGGKEYQIMEMLMRNQSQILPKERFIEKIWGFDSEAEYNNIEVYISFLRKKLSSIKSRAHIRSVRGAGYILEEQSC